MFSSGPYSPPYISWDLGSSGVSHGPDTSKELHIDGIPVSDEELEE